MYFSATNLTGGYGGVNIIEECSFNVNRGEIVSILGPNGAGKSTAMKAMLGILDLKSGKISVSSPVAKSLLGKTVGEVVEATVPNGKVKLEILDISRD